MTKYYVDAQGNYIGGFDGVAPPANTVEVPNAPDDARQKWSGGQWQTLPANQQSVDDQAALNAALTAQGSIVRALGLVMFAEINKLRVKNGDPAYTLAQFVAALQAQMRT